MSFSPSFLPSLHVRLFAALSTFCRPSSPFFFSPSRPPSCLSAPNIGLSLSPKSPLHTQLFFFPCVRLTPQGRDYTPKRSRIRRRGGRNEGERDSRRERSEVESQKGLSSLSFLPTTHSSFRGQPSCCFLLLEATLFFHPEREQRERREEELV